VTAVVVLETLIAVFPYVELCSRAWD
jgi:hypothetical protein